MSQLSDDLHAVIRERDGLRSDLILAERKIAALERQLVEALEKAAAADKTPAAEPLAAAEPAVDLLPAEAAVDVGGGFDDDPEYADLDADFAGETVDAAEESDAAEPPPFDGLAVGSRRNRRRR